MPSTSPTRRATDHDRLTHHDRGARPSRGSTSPRSSPAANAERARDYFTADIAWHGGALGTVTGVDTVVPVLGGFIGALSDIQATVQDAIASDDLVALRLVVTATHTGNLLGVPASGRPVRWDAVDIYRVTDDGRISEQWAFEDLAAILSQVGRDRPAVGRLTRTSSTDTTRPRTVVTARESTMNAIDSDGSHGSRASPTTPRSRHRPSGRRRTRRATTSAGSSGTSTGSPTASTRPPS